MKNKSNTLPAHAAGLFKLGGDLPINRLGFGAMRLTGKNVWGNPQNPKESLTVLRRAIELGINFIDTADSYGPAVNEYQIAEGLYPYPPHLLIATKGGLVRSNPESWKSLGRPEYLQQCVEMSLRRLRLERIDLYQLHAVDDQVSIEESIGALKQMQQQGKIHHIGLSNVSIPEIERAKKIVKIVSVQNLYNLENRQSENVLEYCEKNNLGFIPWFPIASGELARAGGILAQIADNQGATPAQIALAWLLKRSKVMLPIPGTSSLAHLEENVAAASIQLTEEEFSQLNKLSI